MIEIKGIKRGKVIEILEDIDLPDNVEITLLYDAKPLMSESERQEKLKEFFKIPQENREEISAILTELDRERHPDQMTDIELTRNWHI